MNRFDVSLRQVLVTVPRARGDEPGTRLRACFRGYVAAAPLKRLLRAVAGWQGGQFPRLRSRGPIEAGPGSKVSRAGNPCFRGYVAAAPLTLKQKQGLDGPDQGPIGLFPRTPPTTTCYTQTMDWLIFFIVLALLCWKPTRALLGLICLFAWRIIWYPLVLLLDEPAGDGAGDSGAKAENYSDEDQLPPSL